MGLDGSRLVQELRYEVSPVHHACYLYSLRSRGNLFMQNSVNSLGRSVTGSLYAFLRERLRKYFK